MSGNDQIKIKINGKDKQLQENEEVAEDELAAGIAPTNKEDDHAEFEWILPDKTSNHHEVDSFVEDEYTYYPHMRKKNSFTNRNPKINKRGNYRFPLIKLNVPKALIFSIISAIMIGLAFGSIVLMVFTDNNISEPVTNTPTTDVSTPTKEGNETPPPTFDITMDMHVVQGGVFSTQENAETAVQNLKSQGFPAIFVNHDGQFLVFISFAETKQMADEMEASLIEASIEEAFAKPWNYSQVDITVPEGLNSEWVVAGQSLLNQLVQLTSDSFAGAVPVEAANELKTQFDSWEKETPKIENEELAENVSEFVASIGKGIEAVTTTNHWELQQATMDAYVSTINLLQNIVK